MKGRNIPRDSFSRLRKNSEGGGREREKERGREKGKKDKGRKEGEMTGIMSYTILARGFRPALPKKQMKLI